MVSLGETRESYRLFRSARRTLEIAVTEDGRIEVRAPLNLPLARVEGRLRAHLRWIRRRLAERELARPELVPRMYIAGETYRYLGRQYRLNVMSGPRASVRLYSGRLEATVLEPNDTASVRRTLNRWYLAQAKKVLPERLEALLSLPGLDLPRPSGVRIQRMRQRWGSCSSSRRLLLNTDLVSLPVSLIDYVIAHELCHLRVRKHGARFEMQLGRVMPDWRVRHQRLSEVRLD